MRPLRLMTDNDGLDILRRGRCAQQEPQDHRLPGANGQSCSQGKHRVQHIAQTSAHQPERMGMTSTAANEGQTAGFPRGRCRAKERMKHHRP